MTVVAFPKRRTVFSDPDYATLREAMRAALIARKGTGRTHVVIRIWADSFVVCEGTVAALKDAGAVWATDEAQQ